MVMGKLEWNNIKQLVKVRNKDCTGVRNIAIFLLFLFTLNFIIQLLDAIFNRNEILLITYVPVYSYWAFLCMILLCIYYTLTYPDYNMKNQVFPQSNVSRTLSFQLFNYLSFLKIQIFALLLYLFHYGLLFLMNSLLGIYEFAYQFSLLYIIHGFAVNIAYGFLIISFIQLLGAFDCKFHWWFRGSILGFILGIFYFKRNFISLDLILKEESIVKFLIIVISLWFLFSILSIVIAIYTKPYIKTQITTLQIMKLATLLLFLFISFAILIPNRSFNSSTIRHEVIEYNRSSLEDLSPKAKNYNIDISNVPDGTKLFTYSFAKTNNSPFYTVTEGWDYINKTKDQLLIEFYPNEYIVNGVNISLFTKPQLDIKLEDNKLSFEVIERKNLTVVFISPYTFMKQFALYGYFNKYGGNIGTTTTRNFNGSIKVFLPKEKNLTLDFIY